MQIEVPGNQGDTVSQGQMTIETHSYHNNSYYDKEMSRTLYVIIKNIAISSNFLPLAYC